MSSSLEGKGPQRTDGDPAGLSSERIAVLVPARAPVSNTLWPRTMKPADDIMSHPPLPSKPLWFITASS